MPKHAPSRRITPKLLTQQQKPPQPQGQQQSAVDAIVLN